jgi:hypothetical protein
MGKKKTYKATYRKKVDAKHTACLNAATMGVDISVKVRANTMRKVATARAIGSAAQAEQKRGQ